MPLIEKMGITERSIKCTITDERKSIDILYMYV